VLTNLPNCSAYPWVLSQFSQIGKAYVIYARIFWEQYKTLLPTTSLCNFPIGLIRASDLPDKGMCDFAIF
jgi:hypothetical protein